jgi:hypothetical protein
MIESFIIFFVKCQRWSGGYALTTHYGVPSSIPGDPMQDLWWFMCQCSIYTISRVL